MPFRLEHIGFSYPDRVIFQDLSISLKSGHFYGIVGPNGCGKTTLLDLLAGLRHPDAGLARLGDVPIAQIPKHRLARQVALVPQNYHTDFPFTVSEVVLMGRYPHIPRFCQPSPQDMEIVQTVMAHTDTLKFAHRRITELSGGERQRVIFSRALAQDTDILLLDEATANMDIKHALRVLSVAKHRVQQEDKTVIAVFQDINLAAAYCDRMVLMRDGQVVCHGPTADVLTADQLSRVFDVDVKIIHDPFIQADHALFRLKGSCQ